MIGVEKQIYSETYMLLVKYYDCEDTDEVWKAVVNDVKQLVKNYDGYKFARDMALLVVNQLEYKICGKNIGEYDNRKPEEWNYLIQGYLERKEKAKQVSTSKTNTDTLSSRLSKL